jgi:hypothetical protein
VRETVKSLKIKKFASHQIKFDEIPETNPKKVFQDPAELNMSGKKLLLLFVCWNIIRNVSRDLSLRINEKGGTLGPVCVCVLRQSCYGNSFLLESPKGQNRWRRRRFYSHKWRRKIPRIRSLQADQLAPGGWVGSTYIFIRVTYFYFWRWGDFFPKKFRYD